MTGIPDLHGEPELSDPHWDPMWAAAEATGLPVSFHAGGGGMKLLSMENGKVVKPAGREGEFKKRGRGTMQTLGTTTECVRNGITVADLLMSGILARFPKLNFCSVETGAGWVPFVLESLDKHTIKYRVQREHPEMTELPSFYFRRQVYTNCWFEHLTDYHMEVIGADNILFETDFPHPTCLIGDEINEAIEIVTGALSKEDQEKILWKNATKLFKLDDKAFGLN